MRDKNWFKPGFNQVLFPNYSYESNIVRLYEYQTDLKDIIC